MHTLFLKMQIFCKWCCWIISDYCPNHAFQVLQAAGNCNFLHSITSAIESGAHTRDCQTNNEDGTSQSKALETVNRTSSDLTKVCHRGCEYGSYRVHMDLFKFVAVILCNVITLSIWQLQVINLSKSPPQTARGPLCDITNRSSDNVTKQQNFS